MFNTGELVVPSRTQPLILTLKLDDPAFRRLDELRRRYFPPDRNIVPAHITLFHQLPGEQESMVTADLRQACSARSPFDLEVSGLRFLGRGVAIDVHAAELRELRSALATAWNGWLTNQDRQTYRPHVTISNRVTPDAARELYNHLRLELAPICATAAGLTLWRYLGGPWSLRQDLPFGGASSMAPSAIRCG